MLRTPVDPKTEADFRSITREQLRNSRALPSIPFLVLTCRDRAKAMPPVFSDEALEAIARLDLELMNRLAGAIPGGRHVLVECTSHYFHVDEPRLLTVPVLVMIRDLRSKSREHRQQRPR